jgi:hypothetical protein
VLIVAAAFLSVFQTHAQGSVLLVLAAGSIIQQQAAAAGTKGTECIIEWTRDAFIWLLSTVLCLLPL